MANLIVVLVIALILGAAIAFIIKEKKRGVKCIGCPAGANCPSAQGAGGCSGKCSGCTGCHDSSAGN